MNFVLVAAGGAAGSVCRWLLASAMVVPASRWQFPAGTLLVNVLGSLLVGWFAAKLGETGSDARLLLVTGFCGGFTTFSAFTLEALRLAQDGRGGRALLYVATSLALGLGGVAAGWTLGQRG